MSSGSTEIACTASTEYGETAPMPADKPYQVKIMAPKRKPSFKPQTEFAYKTETHQSSGF